MAQLSSAGLNRSNKEEVKQENTVELNITLENPVGPSRIAENPTELWGFQWSSEDLSQTWKEPAELS